MKKQYEPIEIKIKAVNLNCFLASIPDLPFGDDDYVFDDSPF